MKRCLFSVFVSVLAGVSLVGCSNSNPVVPNSYAFDKTRSWRPQFESIKLDDGIDAAEADLLATLYFARYEGMCGANFPVIRDKGRWRALTVVGYSGTAQPDIFVDAKTGVISHKGYPDSVPPWRDLREMCRILN
ncbi:MAG: hypothetical protein IAE77_24695 [Prosthecobacter sp.]|jgi:hypothetical protein|uniref:hypothetical protein n=1 Tax=Prosthecobacter sp. TaxID=1965333 RepID=UPI001A099140|nr:hypothetical protein [Prosthecobacter sp.]MBE2286678.1 hypothetical protein [Prosthecobacter sp.]